ncbi:phage portal protein [Sinorhizobium fredii]|uniref:phage portal protein n=1 Tax=Rhizobium fredii TaxID=380 RepID=UPI0030AD4D99
MTKEQDKSDRPAAQIYRLASLSKSGAVLEEIATKAEAKAAVQANAYEPEDEYRDLYIGQTRDTGVLEPPYNLRRLDRLAQENNTLSPCIEAMVTNIDGTGYDFENRDEEAEDQEDDVRIDQLTEFFEQPWPGMSFITIRKALRRDLERTGNAYLEVLRNAQDEIVFLRNVDAKMMRLVKLDDPVPVDFVVRRKGVEVTMSVMVRQRRFCQLVNGVSLVYFKEFGVKRDLNKKTGRWVSQGQRLPAPDRGTEIIHFTALPDAHTPYGVPRWVNQMPSVLGSRKAEEFNLEFFDNGGVPPVLILLQGGTLQEETRKALEQKMGRGAAHTKNRVQVLEVEPSGGSLDSTPNARVTVERFGAERQNDAMFENYDEKCEVRLRRSFRLPPIFVGQAADYSFATAAASYQMAEAQVFKPERDEFDEVISMKLLAAMGYPDYRMVSKPLVIEDATLKLQGIEVALATNQVDLGDVIYEINEAAGTNIKISDKPRPLGGATHTIDNEGNIVPLPTAPANQNAPPCEKPGAGKPQPKQPEQAQVIKGEPRDALGLAVDMMLALRKRDMAALSRNLALFQALDSHGQEEVRKATASLQYLDPSTDLDGLGDLMGCTIAVMAQQYADNR